jgi:Uma2 family endonuclease
MIEVVAGTPRDGRRDRIEKAIDYAAFGVSAYWIIDPQERTLEVLRLGSDGRYVAAILATGGAVRPIEGEDELVLDLDALWAELDALSAEE